MRVAGIDIGGTKCALGVFEGRELLESHSLPTLDFESTLSALADWISERKVEAVGIGCAGPLDEAEGLVKNVESLKQWFDAPLVPSLKERLGLPVSMVNDADAALLGELWAGCLRDKAKEPAVLLTLGTGVGGAFWDGRKRLVGAYGEHPEIGHVSVGGDRTCYCRLTGCLEAEICGMTLNKLAMDEAFADFAAVVASGDPEPYFARVRKFLGIAIRVLGHAYRPATVVVGGGLAQRFGAKLLPYLQLTHEEAPMLTQPLNVVLAQRGNEAGIYGAAALASGDMS